MIVTSGTASGKSLSFNLPVLDAIARDPKPRALYLYPTKALAQDQARKLSELGLARAAPRDLRRRHPARGPAGDPPALEPRPDQPGHAQRRRARPTTRAGATSSPTSRWVVVDEAHTYRGVFGSHVANVLRRLRRVARALRRRAAVHPRLGDDRQPGRARRAARRASRSQLVDSDGAPAGRAPDRDLEPAADRRGDGARRSALSEAAELLADLVVAGVADDLLPAAAAAGSS